MMRAKLFIALASLSACIGKAEGETIDFPVAAAGPAEASGGSLVFATDTNWNVVLTKATLHIGGVYLNQARPVSGAQATDCFLPGTYVAQETSGLDVDLLTGTPQYFGALGHGTNQAAQVGQVWLTNVRVDDAEDAAPVLLLQGTAEKAGVSQPFTGRVTIGANRQAEGAFPGAYPICKQRIVSPIDAPFAVHASGGLLVRIDPRAFFKGVDFDQVPNGTFTDADGADKPSTLLYSNLRAAGAGGPYTMQWSDALERP